MRTNTIQNFAKRLVMVLAVGMMAINAWGTDVKKDDVLLLESFKGGSSGAFSENTYSSSYSSLTMAVSGDASSISYASDDACFSTTTAGNMSGTHAWLNSSTTGYVEIDNIPLHNTTKFKIGCSKTGSVGLKLYYKFNGDASWTQAGTDWPNAARADSLTPEISVTSGKTSISIKFERKNNSSNLRIDNLKLVATAIAAVYGVTYNNGGHGTAPSSTTASSVTLSAITGVTGYTCTGWTADKAVTVGGVSKSAGTLLTNGSTATLSAATTFTAQWSAHTTTISFNQNSGEGGQTTSKTATYGSAMPTPITCPTRTHYDFGGYYDGTGGTGTQYYTNTGASARSWDKDVATATLYAKWTEHSLTNYRTICSATYDITLDDGEVATTNNGSATVASNGTQLTDISAPTKTGYKVAGYYAESGKTNLVAAADGTLEKSVEISSTAWTNSDGEWVKGSGATLYADWTPISYEVRFNSNDENYLGTAEGSMSNESYDYDESKDLIDVGFTLAGYDFAGWALTADGSVEHEDGAEVENLSETDGDVVDLYAIWTAKKYTLTLANTDASSGNSQTVQATYNSAMPLVTTEDGTPDVAALSRTGYTFDGWEYSSTQYYSYDAGEDEISSAHIWDVASTATLTPRWNINSYTLTWNLDGGTVTEAGTGAAVDATGAPNSEVEYNAAISVPTVTKAGYTFAGWSSTPADNMPASNTTYTATWTALHDKYYDRMHETGGLTDASGYKYTDMSGAGYSVPSCTDKDGETGNIQCEKDHYKFLGWLESTYINDDGSLKDGATSHLIPASGTTDATGKTYYAIWGEE